MTPQQALREHLKGDGTANDARTEELYREAHYLDESIEIPLEDIEQWAFNVINTKAIIKARADRTVL